MKIETPLKHTMNTLNLKEIQYSDRKYNLYSNKQYSIQLVYLSQDTSIPHR